MNCNCSNEGHLCDDSSPYVKEPSYGFRFCINCGAKVPIFHKKRLTTDYVCCSVSCLSAYRRAQGLNTFCAYCGKAIHVKPSHISEKHGNCCSYDCSSKLRATIYKGEANPNHKYEVDLSWVYNLTHNGAYLLGLIWADGHLENTTITISQNEDYSGDLLLSISRLLYGFDNRREKISGSNMYSLNINSKDFVDYLISLGGINIGKKSATVSFPNIPKEFHWSFVCGFFDGDGSFKYNYRYPEIQIGSKSSDMLRSIAKIWDVNYTGKRSICASGNKALDICGEMYKNVTLCHEKKYEYFVSILNYEPLNPRQKDVYIDTFKVRKLRKDALLPYKARVTDSGYDLSVVEFEEMGPGLFIGNTKIAIEPPPGYYFDMVGRSSLPKNNMHFVGGVGVLDKSYVGPVKIVLQQIDTTKPLPELPFRCAQIIPRKIVHFNVIEVEELSESSRGDGGFGSTDNIRFSTHIPSDVAKNQITMNTYIKNNKESRC